MADYALDGKYEKEAVRATVDIAEDNIAGFEQADARHRRALLRMCCSGGGRGDDRRKEREMTEQQIREIAEAAFKGKFPDVVLDRVNIWPGFGFEDDSPIVDVHIIYDGEYEQLNARGLSQVLTEVVSKAFWEAEENLGFPCVHFFSKPALKRRRRDLATV